MTDMDEVRVDNFIYCTKTRRGNGTSRVSPIRVITEIYDLKGNLIADNDPYETNVENVLSFILSRFPSIDRKKAEQNIYDYFIRDGNQD